MNANELKKWTIYEQTANIENPKPDRRRTDALLCQPVIPAGTRWLAVPNTVPGDGAEYLLLEPLGEKFPSSSRITEWSSPQDSNRSGEARGPSFWELLLPTLEESQPEKPSEVYAVENFSGGSARVMELLLRSGVLTLSMLREVVATIERAHRDVAWDRKADPSGEEAHEAAESIAANALATKFQFAQASGSLPASPSTANRVVTGETNSSGPSGATAPEGARRLSISGRDLDSLELRLFADATEAIHKSIRAFAREERIEEAPAARGGSVGPGGVDPLDVTALVEDLVHRFRRSEIGLQSSAVELTARAVLERLKPAEPELLMEGVLKSGTQYVVNVESIVYPDVGDPAPDAVPKYKPTLQQMSASIREAINLAVTHSYGNNRVFVRSYEAGGNTGSEIIYQWGLPR